MNFLLLGDRLPANLVEFFLDILDRVSDLEGRKPGYRDERQPQQRCEPDHRACSPAEPCRAACASAAWPGCGGGRPPARHRAAPGRWLGAATSAPGRPRPP